jgi:hypothetical protein
VGWQEGYNVKRPSGFFNVNISPGEMSHRRLATQQRTRHEALCGDDSVGRLLRLEALARVALRRPRSFWLESSRMPPGLGSCQSSPQGSRVSANPGCQISPCNWTQISSRGHACPTPVLHHRQHTDTRHCRIGRQARSIVELTMIRMDGDQEHDEREVADMQVYVHID